MRVFAEEALPYVFGFFRILAQADLVSLKPRFVYGTTRNKSKNARVMHADDV